MIDAWIAQKVHGFRLFLMKKLPLLFLFLLLGLLTACNIPERETQQPTREPEKIQLIPTFTPLPTDTPAPTNTPLPTATLNPSSFGPTDFPSDVNPLTGKRVEDPQLLERSPLAVKVQIFPRGQRPPWGVTLADIVYDFYQNNGLTRFHAIFLGNDALQVGPIRSARLFDGELVEMYESIFAFGGADRRILTKLLNAPYADRLILEGYSQCPPMCRVDPNGLNYLMTNTHDLSEYATQQGISNGRQNLDGMTFNSITPAGGEPINKVIIRFSISSYNSWDYDVETGMYLRFQDTHESPDIPTQGYEALIDPLTGEQIAADNIVIVLAPNEFTPGSKPGKSEIVEITLSGSGQAFAFRDGQKFDVIWNRPEDSSVLFLTYPDGSPFPFKPGNTYFEMIGQSSKIDIPGDGTINYHFSIP